MRVTAQGLKDCSSKSFLWADYHPSLLCSRMDQQSLLPLTLSIGTTIIAGVPVAIRPP